MDSGEIEGVVLTKDGREVRPGPGDGANNGKLAKDAFAAWLMQLIGAESARFSRVGM